MSLCASVSHRPLSSSRAAGTSDSPEIRVLLGCLHADPRQLEACDTHSLTPDDWDRFVRLTRRQQVRGLAHQRLKQSGHWRAIPSATWQRFGSEYQEVARQQLFMHFELSSLLTQLSTHDISVIVLKGGFLGPVVYKDVGLREMRDVDVLVPKNQWHDAVAAAEAVGFARVHSDVAEGNPALHPHITLSKIGLVEIHWTITDPDEPGAIDPEPLWQRSRTLQVAGRSTRYLGPVDQLLHLCFHASFHHRCEFGLRPSCDIQRLITHYGSDLDWDDLVRTCRERRWVRGVALTLALAHDLVGAVIPAEVTRQLGSVEGALEAARALVWSRGTKTALTLSTTLSGLGPGASWVTAGAPYGNVHFYRPKSFSRPRTCGRVVKHSCNCGGSPI